jgi:hypothetical protein
VDEVSTNIEPNKIVNDAPVVELSWVPRYRKSAARPRAAPTALDPDHLHERGRARAEGEVAPELVDADQEGARTAGGGDVRQGMAGERLPAGNREHAHDGRRHRDDGPDGQRDVDRPAAEEARLEDVPDQVAHTGYRTTVASCAAASAPSGAATTRTRPCTRITSTC